MELAGEAEDVAEDVVGDDVREEAAHVGERAGMVDQLGEDVVLEARRRRLHPAEPAGGAEQRGRQLAEEGVGVGDGLQGLGVVAGVDDGHEPAASDASQPLVLDGGMDDQLHAWDPSVGE